MARQKLKNAELAKRVWMWFPHVWIKAADYYDDDDDDADYDDAADFNDKNAKIAISPLVTRKLPWSNSIPYAPNINNDFLRALYFVASLAITAENSFWLSSSVFPSNIKHAAESFLKSTASVSVSQQIHTVFQNKFPEFPALTQESQIALPLSKIINNNFLAHNQ